MARVGNKAVLKSVNVLFTALLPLDGEIQAQPTNSRNCCCDCNQ